jgi:hypothetical protein
MLKDIAVNFYYNTKQHTLLEALRRATDKLPLEQAATGTDKKFQKLLTDIDSQNYENLKIQFLKFEREIDILMGTMLAHRKMNIFETSEGILYTYGDPITTREEIEKPKKIFLLILLLRNITLLHQLVTTPKNQSSVIDLDAQQTLLRSVFVKYWELFNALENEVFKPSRESLSYRGYKIIADYANNEAEKTLKCPTRPAEEVKIAADDFVKNLESRPIPSFIRGLAYTVAIALIAAGIGMALFGLSCLCFGPMGVALGGLIGGCICAIVVAMLCAHFYHDHFETVELAPYLHDKAVLPKNSAYQKVTELKNSFFTAYNIATKNLTLIEATNRNFLSCCTQ